MPVLKQECAPEPDLLPKDGALGQGTLGEWIRVYARLSPFALTQTITALFLVSSPTQN